MTDGGAPAPPTVGAGGRRWRRPVVSFGSILVLLVLAEVFFRHVHAPSLGLSRYRWRLAVTEARWSFLEERRDQLQFECRPNAPNETSDRRAEMDRPPFDRVAVPYTVTNNALGYRDGPFAEPKLAGTRRVLVLGDSNAYGKGVAEPERFSSVVRAQAPPGVDLYNLALPSCTTSDLRRTLQQFLRLDPDLVVVQAPSNDFDLALWRSSGYGDQSWLSRFTGGAVAWSATLQALKYALFGDPYEGLMAQRDELTATAYREDAEGLMALCAEQGCRVVVVRLVAPDGRRYGAHVGRACLQRPATCVGVLEVDLTVPSDGGQAAEPSAWMRETADFVGLPLETLEQLLPLHRYFHDIIHLNGAGNRVAGQQLAAFLREHWRGWGP